ncbi:conserved hypothetical protein [Planktothrix serta PCC 8927]|uniref:Uncharacterized protein n=1 Tax=Planktothrix serta PCC 8927 TaxID=671068 RepID=A0A7Z9DW67_9CYAN|nr:hypothetical protein [Planktothrix serta]VXD14156.1 conserved hypothetical protein [Planktothrix serta PCC 8927]
MNADTFNTHSVTCPICHHTSILPAVGMLGGLFTCPHCHTHFVMSRSGHYVRDPFCLQQCAVAQMLRRQSHPFARIRRDLSLTKGLPLLAVISSLLFLGIAVTINDKLNLNNQTFEHQVESLPKPSLSSPDQ